MRLGLWAACFLTAMMPTAACAMDAQSFYTSGLALKKKGPAAALISPELQPLLAEVRLATKTVKAENGKAKLSGKPLFCVPEKNAMTPDELLTEFGRIPKPRRTKISVTQALREILIRKYPC